MVSGVGGREGWPVLEIDSSAQVEESETRCNSTRSQFCSNSSKNTAVWPLSHISIVGITKCLKKTHHRSNKTLDSEKSVALAGLYSSLHCCHFYYRGGS